MAWGPYFIFLELEIKQKKEFIKSKHNLEKRKNVDVLELGERQEKLRKQRENIEERHEELRKLRENIE